MDFLQYIRGGMHKDNEVSAQPKDTYRDANNGYLFSGNGEFFSFTTAKGNKFSFEVPISPYSESSTFPDSLLERIIIGWVEGTDGLFLFVTTNESTGGYGEILKVVFDEVAGTGSVSVVYQNGLLNFTTKHPIGNEAIYIEESDTVGRIYWTDNYNPPRVINVFSPPDISNPDLIGTINLTPSLRAAYTEFMGTLKDRLQKDISGLLNCGMYRYTYRLANPSDGAFTNWSPLTNPVFIGPKTTGKIGNYSTYLDYIGYEGGASADTTTKGIRMELTDLDTRYGEIEVGAFYYNGTDINPNGAIIKKSNYPATSFKFTHEGPEFLGTITPGEVEITTASIEQVKTITTNKNRLMFGNITEIGKINLKAVADGIGIKTFPYTYISDTSGFPQILFQNNDTYRESTLTEFDKGFFGHGAAQGWGVSSGDIHKGQWYGVNLSGNAPHEITYDGNVYDNFSGAPTYFKGTEETTYTVTSGGYAFPVRAFVRVKRYKSQDTNIGDVYDNVVIPNEFLDNKGVFNNHYVQGYWRGETYRFGLVVWDKYMAPTFVQWIADVDTPEQYEELDIADFNGYKGADLCNLPGQFNFNTQYLRNLGLRFDNIDLSSIATDLGIPEAELPNHISGFSIVRAPRDEQIIAQGLLLQVAEGSELTETDSVFYGNYFPFNWGLTTDFPSQTGFTGRQKVTGATRKYGKLISPDQLFNYKDRFSQGSDTVPIIETKITTLKLLGRMVFRYLGQGYSSNPNVEKNLNGARNLKFNYNGASSGNPHGGYVDGYTRYLERRDSIENEGDEIVINSIRSFGMTTNPFSFDPKKPSQKFKNMLWYRYHNNFTNTSGLNSVVDDDECNWGSGGAIINLEEMLPEITSPVPIQQESWGENQPGGAGHGYAHYVNIKNKKTPYGGTSEAAKSQTVYVPTGHFQPISSEVYANNGYSWKFDEVEVFGGDCHVQLFDVTTEVSNTNNYNRSTDGNTRYAEMRCYTDVFPVESNVNVGLREGRHANEHGIMSAAFIGSGNVWTIARDDPANTVNANGISSATQENFIYNEAYSEMDGNVFYVSSPINFNAKESFINRVRYSLAKISNEPVDNFRKFLIDNFKDVDIQNRAINNLRVRGENLYYWQDRAVGYLPINERVTVPTALGEPVEIGVGGVMTRYDERTDFYGNQHKHGLIETPAGFIWIDRKNRALVSMSLGGETAELSAMKGMMSFFDPLIKRTTEDNPIDRFSNGMLGVYDARTKNTYISFVGNYSVEGVLYVNTEEFTVSVSFSPPFQNLIQSLGLTYINMTYVNSITGLVETISVLIGGYPISGNGVLLSLDVNPDGTLSEGLQSGMTVTLHSPMEAETVAINQLNGNFISRYSFHPSMYMRYSDTMLSIPSVNQGTRKEVYIHDEGDLAEFYNTVYDTDITLVINPNVELPKVFDNIEMNIGANSPSSIEYATSFQDATDLNIKNNTEYSFRNRDWIGTVARDQTPSGMESRMRDHYMKIKLVKDNKLNNDATVSSNEEIKLLSLKTVFRTTF